MWSLPYGHYRLTALFLPQHAKTIKNIAEFQSRLETFPILKPFINID